MNDKSKLYKQIDKAIEDNWDDGPVNIGNDLINMTITFLVFAEADKKSTLKAIKEAWDIHEAFYKEHKKTKSKKDDN